MNIRKSKGITLVALVVTIIVLIILAGITINLALGENNIFNRALEAKQTYEEQKAREKLEIELASLFAEKESNSEYNDEYLTKKLEEKGFIVNENIVFVDEWQFQINKSVPQIEISLGKGKPNEEIKLTLSQKLSEDYIKSTIKAEIEFSGEIEYVQIAGEKKEELKKDENGKYIVEKEVTDNGKYIVYVKDTEGKYKIGNIDVTGITENIAIHNIEEMIEFRDSVNNGRTYEGRTVQLMNDIDLHCTEENQWVPIGTQTNQFKGTFEGKNCSITNIYINAEKSSQGLFGAISGTVENLSVEGNITGINKVGGIVGQIINSNGATIINCKNYVNVTASADYHAGGIVGFINNSSNIEISNCSNFKNISSQKGDAGGIVGTVNKSTKITISNCENRNNTIKAISESWAGGIVGVVQYNAVATIKNSINAGTIFSKQYASGGICGGAWSSKIYIENCYNTGSVTASIGSLGGIVGNIDRVDGDQNAYVEISNSYNKGTIAIASNNVFGGVLGYVNTSGASYKLENNYWLSNCGAVYGIGTGSSNTNAVKKTSTELQQLAKTLGSDNWTDDIQYEDENGEKQWKYNEGYPILKWQKN